MNLLAFAASNSKNSINKKLVTYASSLIKNAQVEILDLNDFEMPIYSIDREQESGIPQLAHQFFEKVGAADALLISYAEHNGAYSAAYKNIYDWASRINAKVFQEKSMVLLSTSPGARGAKSVLDMAATSAPFFGGTVVSNLSVPSFYDNFDVELGEVSNKDIREQLKETILKLAE